MAKITYSDNLAEGTNAKCYYPFPYMFGIGECKIVIRPRYKNNTGTLNHELVHEKQYKSSWFHSQKYYLFKEYRFECELEAFTEDIKYRNARKIEDCMDIVNSLYGHYKTGYSKEYITSRVEQVIKRINQ